MPSQSCNWATILIGGVSHNRKQKGPKKGAFWSSDPVNHFWKYTFVLVWRFVQKTIWTYSQNRENETEVTQQSRYDCESKVCQQDGCKIISWTWRPLSPKTLHIFFGSKINHRSADFSSYNCTRSNVHPRSVNRLVAKLFPGPGDLFHPDKAILSRHC